MDKETQDMSSGFGSAHNSSSPKVHRIQYSGGNTLSMFLLVVVVSVIGFFGYSQNSISRYEKEWQAVFLSNGQVYFGKVTKHNKSEMKLIDIYYLQVTQPLQQSADKKETQAKSEMSLVRLGTELHGPTSSMVINTDHILFVEDLREDSSVVKAIVNYKAKQQE